MQIQKAFIELFRALINSTGVLGSNNLLFVYNHVTHMQETSLLSNIKLCIIYCATALQPPHFGMHHKLFPAVAQKASSTKCLCLWTQERKLQVSES